MAFSRLSNVFFNLSAIIFFTIDSGHVFANEWFARVEGAASVGQFIGQKENYVEYGIFTGPAPSNNSFGFADIRGYKLADGRSAASAGVGFRIRNPNMSGLFGANVYYDYFEVDEGHFNQVGVGCEFLGNCFDFRLNGYIPTESTVQSCFDVTQYQGGYFLKRQEKNFSFKGVDGEVGYRLYQNRDFRVYTAAGPYYYSSKNVSHVYGGQFRLECYLFDYLTLEGRYSGDNHFHQHFQGKLTLSLPLSNLLSRCCCYDRCKALFTQPVKRNGLGFFSRCCNAKWNW